MTESVFIIAYGLFFSEFRKVSYKAEKRFIKCVANRDPS